MVYHIGIRPPVTQHDHVMEEEMLSRKSRDYIADIKGRICDRKLSTFLRTCNQRPFPARLKHVLVGIISVREVRGG